MEIKTKYVYEVLLSAGYNCRAYGAPFVTKTVHPQSYVVSLTILRSSLQSYVLSLSILRSSLQSYVLAYNPTF